MVPRRCKDRREVALFLNGPEKPQRRQEFSVFVFGSELSWRQGRDTLVGLAARVGPVQLPVPATDLAACRHLRLSASGLASAELDSGLGEIGEIEEPGQPGQPGPWVTGPWHMIRSRGLDIEGPALDPIDLDPLDTLDDDVWDRGSGTSEHVEHHHQRAAEHLEHHPHDDTMTDIGVALISSGTTIFLAFMSAIFAMRLFREMMRPPQQIQGLNAGADGDVPGVLQLDIPGVQPFRPFSGQGYRLVVEDSKAEPEVSRAVQKDTPRSGRSLSPVSVVSVGGQPSGALPDPSEAGRPALPQFGALDDAPEVTAPAP